MNGGRPAGETAEPIEQVNQEMNRGSSSQTVTKSGCLGSEHDDLDLENYWPYRRGLMAHEGQGAGKARHRSSLGRYELTNFIPFALLQKRAIAQNRPVWTCTRPYPNTRTDCCEMDTHQTLKYQIGGASEGEQNLRVLDCRTGSHRLMMVL